MNWISVSNKLPEEKKDVLVRIAENYYDVACLIKYDVDWWFEEDTGRNLDNVTHWCYIEEPTGNSAKSVECCLCNENIVSCECCENSKK